MRALKIAGIVMGSLVGLVVLVLLAVLLLVDPNDYRDRIAAQVRSSTGRELSLSGELKLSIFPWVAIETGEASLGNPPGFGDEPFLSLRHAKLSVKLLPLLRRQLEVGRIQIDGLDLRLQQDSAGKGNWEDWGASEPVDADAEAVAGGGPQYLQLEGITITEGRIAFDDLAAEQVAIEIGRLGGSSPVPVSLKMQLSTEPGSTPLPLAADFSVQLDLDKQRYQLHDLDLAGSVQPEGAPRRLDWRFAAPLADLDLAAQTLAATPFTAEVGLAKLTGNVWGEKLVDEPALAGTFSLAQLAPRQLMEQFGIASPDTRDAGALASFAAGGAWTWSGGVARLRDLKVSLDESALSGRFAYDTTSGGMDFALKLDRIDLDRYQPPPTAPAVAAEPIELPVEFLKPLRARGTVEVSEIKVGGANLESLSAGINVADAVARFAPLQAQLYGGRYNGDIRLDMRPAVPLLTMDEHLQGIDIAKLMKEYADSERLVGAGNLDAKLSASGTNGDALLQTLNGTIGLNLENGAVLGADIWFAIAQAQSLLRDKKLADIVDQKRTVFDQFHASASLANGVATTKDLEISSQLLRITGTGTTSLVTKAINYAVTAKVLKAPPGADGVTADLVSAVIPVKITGTLDDPKVRPDVEDMVKERVRQELDKHKDEVEKKVKDTVKDTLKGLFGR